MGASKEQRFVLPESWAESSLGSFSLRFEGGTTGRDALRDEDWILLTELREESWARSWEHEQQ